MLGAENIEYFKTYIEGTYFLLNTYDPILNLGLTVLCGSVFMQG